VYSKPDTAEINSLLFLLLKHLVREAYREVDTSLHALLSMEVLGGDLSGSSFSHFTSEKETWNPDVGLDREVRNIKLPTPDTLSSIRQSAILLLALSWAINWRKRFYFKGIICTERFFLVVK
jgi:hypothetical protein